MNFVIFCEFCDFFCELYDFSILVNLVIFCEFYDFSEFSDFFVDFMILVKFVISWIIILVNYMNFATLMILLNSPKILNVRRRHLRLFGTKIDLFF